MSDILKMLEMFYKNHEFAPAAQRDLDEIINALRATPAPVAQKDGPVTVRELLDSGMCPVPNGWALVPNEPTAEMTLAGVREAVSHPRPNVYRIYLAMLAAAQAQDGKP